MNALMKLKEKFNEGNLYVDICNPDVSDKLLLLLNKLIFLYLETRRCKCYTLNIMYSKTSLIIEYIEHNYY